MKARVFSRLRWIRFISKKKISYNLRKRIANFARRMGCLRGPIEIITIRELGNIESGDYYSLDIVLHNRVTEEMGAHNRFFKNIKFKRIKYKKGVIG